MQISKKKSFITAINYAKKFGFISKSFYWDYLTPNSLSTKYVHWDLFLKSNFFIPYQETENSSEFFYLNPKKSKFADSTIEPVSRRSPYYFFHDDKIMRIIHLLSTSGLVKKYWTEQELKSNRSLSLDLLGGDYTKLPDLIFDLNISDETFRIALEVEITRKSNDRYLRSFIGYSGFRNVDLILFASQQTRITTALKAALSKQVYIDAAIKFGFFDLIDFSEQNLEADLEINSKRIPLGQFFRNLIEIKGNKTNFESQKYSEKKRKFFRKNLPDREEAA